MTEDRKPAPQYLIWSNEHRAWWRPKSCGYTIHVDAAGRYAHDEALEICRSAHDGWWPGSPPPEIPVLEDHAIVCVEANARYRK
jgi:hypothetical protein